jgi:hypothetical protein
VAQLQIPAVCWQSVQRARGRIRPGLAPSVLSDGGRGHNPLSWRDQTYKSLPTEFGHVELEVPPGSYAVFAVQEPAGIPPFGNLLTNVAVVRVNCGDHACVTLFAPDAHLCGSWFGDALRYIADLPEVPRELAAVAIEAVNNLIAVLEPTTFSRNLEAFKPGGDDR